MAITYKQAVEFMNGPIGSQIPYVARVLRPSNWNNLNGGLKAKYLGEIEKAINDPVKFSLEKLREAVSQYVVYSNIGGKTGKAEAADYKANIDKYVPFLQSQGQSVDDITSVINKGSLAGVERLAEHEKRINEVSPIDKVVDVGLQIGLATATAGLSLPAQIGANAALQIAQGAKPADVVRNVVGTVAANSLTQGIPGIESSKIIPKTLNEVNKAIANIAPDIVNSTVGSALINAERQAVAALITKQDVGQNAIAGAIGGTVADIAKVGFDDPLTQKTIGEYAKYNALGMSPQDAALMAGVDYLGDVSSQPATRPSSQADEEISPVAAAPGSKIGSTLAGVGDIDFTVPSNIANKPEFKTMPGEAGENIIQYTDNDGIVSYRKNVTSTTPSGKKFGYTIVYDDLNGISYQYSLPKEGLDVEIVSTKTRPSVENLDTIKKVVTSADEVSPDVLSVKPVKTQTDQTVPSGGFKEPTVKPITPDIRAEAPRLPPVEVEGDFATPVQEMPTLSLLNRVRVGAETKPDASQATKKLPAIEVTGKEEEEPEILRLIKPPKEELRKTEEEVELQRKPTDSVILDLISGGSGAQQAARQQRSPDQRELASMQALSQALSIGDPGDTLFGSGLGRRKNVWNVESLRLKDELGG